MRDRTWRGWRRDRPVRDGGGRPPAGRRGWRRGPCRGRTSGRRRIEFAEIRNERAARAGERPRRLAELRLHAGLPAPCAGRRSGGRRADGVLRPRSAGEQPGNPQGLHRGGACRRFPGGGLRRGADPGAGAGGDASGLPGGDDHRQPHSRRPQRAEILRPGRRDHQGRRDRHRGRVRRHRRRRSAARAGGRRAGGGTRRAGEVRRALYRFLRARCAGGADHRRVPAQFGGAGPPRRTGRGAGRHGGGAGTLGRLRAGGYGSAPAART